MTNDFITRRLFNDLSVYEFLLPWQTFIPALEKRLKESEISNRVVTKVEGTTKIVNSLIAPNVQLGDFSLVRNSIIESGVKIGAHVQINMSIIRSGTDLPHFNNVGYSFVGLDVLFGAASTTSSRRLDERFPSVVLPNGDSIHSQSRKFGSIIGDGCRIGSHVCLNPFTVLEKGVLIYPNQSISGYVERS